MPHDDGVGIRYVSERHIVVGDNPMPALFWEPIPIFKDKTVVLLGGGPSHVEINPGLLSNCGIVAINSSCRKVMDVAKKEDILYFSDNSWSERYIGLIEEWKGLVITSNRNTKIRLQGLVNRLDLQNLTEFMQVKSDYVQGSSGHTGACLAVLLGAKRLVLVGFECKSINGKTHGHGDYQQENIHAFEERYIPAWFQMAKRFRELGCEVINASKDSAIDCFEFMNFEEAICDV
jgi:hypothetical protein